MTLNDDIVVTLNDVIVILTSTILVNLVITLVNHVSSRQRTIAKYMLVSLYVRAHGNTDEIFIYINESFFFLTDLLGYMIIQIIYKQLLLTHISKGIGMNMTQGLMSP